MPRSYIVERVGRQRQSRRYLMRTGEQEQKSITNDSEQGGAQCPTAREEESNTIDAQSKGVTEPGLIDQSSVTEPNINEARYPKRIGKPPVRLDL